MTTHEKLLQDHWGLSGELTRLGGENTNYLVTTAQDERFVLKIVHDRNTPVELEEDVAMCLSLEGVPIASSIPTITGQPAAQLGDSVARLQPFMPGTLWRDCESSESLLRSIGRTLGTVHALLQTFESPAAHRSHRWDLARFDHLSPLLSFVIGSEKRSNISRCFHIARAWALPILGECPRGVLHGDFNDENLLIANDAVIGVLDFGDCLHGALVQDLAIALAYTLEQPEMSLERASALIAGYEEIRTLEEPERSALFPLSLARLATSALICAERRAERNDHTTWFSHEESTHEAITRNATVAPDDAERVLFRKPQRKNTNLPKRRARLAPSLSLSYNAPLHITRGRGQYLFAADGRPYLDLVNNVCHVGHAHPRVIDAIASQARVLNTNTRYLHEEVIAYAEELCALLPETLDTCFFVNCGSEANELALRLARAATGHNDVLVVDGAYHGSTGSLVEMSPYKFNGPGGHKQSNWVHVAPAPDVYRGAFKDSDAGSAYALELACVIGDAARAGRSIGGFFVEPILSCAGQIPLAKGFLDAAFAHVRKAGGVCIADEVQIGFGRVGESFWGFQLHAVTPDIVVMGKPIGNGHPMAAVVTTRAIAEAFNDGMEYFSTFGGNPVSAACGRAVLEVIRSEGLQERARDLGARFIAGLRALQDSHKLIGDVRGHGLFLGIELVRDRTTLEPAAKEATAVVEAMREEGILLSADGSFGNVIKIKPPLVLSAEDVDRTIDRLDSVFSVI